MTKEQKAVLQSQLNSEKRTLNELKQVYQRALMDCEKKIMELSARTDLENLQSIIYQTRYQEVIRQQLEGILAALQSDSYSTVSDYLSRCYQDGYIGVMYDLHGQDIPLIMPIDQKAVTRAIQTDSKISKGLYNRLGEDVGKLKTSIRAEVSRGIAAGYTWNEVATKLAKSFKTTEFSKAYNNAMRIVRTEGHRIQVQSAMDAQQVAKDYGADIVKQWDATLDDRTRETHRMLDGQIRELDELFEVGGMQADAPGMFGDPAEDCNCRCALLQRARWALNEDELNTLKERAEFFGLDKTKDFEEFKEKYIGIPKEDISAANKQIAYRRKPVSEGIFETINIANMDSIRPRTIANKMKQSDIGRDILKYLQENDVKVNLFYGIDNPNNLYGFYDVIDDEITVYCDYTKTASKTAEIVIHEATHRMSGTEGTLEEEVKCFEAEQLHRKGKLTDDDKKDILKKVKELYPEL